MILTTRGRGVQFPRLYRPSLIRRPEFILVDEASIVPQKLLNPRCHRFRLFSPALGNAERTVPGNAKKAAEVTMSKVFTILNLLTFDGVKYMESGDLCSGAWTDCI